MKITGIDSGVRGPGDTAFSKNVGIEGGVATFGESTAADAPEIDQRDGAFAIGSDALFLVMWAAVTDGQRWGVGAGPTLPLPTSIGDRIRAGEELGPGMDDVLDEANVAKKQGAAGAFTDGAMTRTDALDSAVTAAASPFLSQLY